MRAETILGSVRVELAPCPESALCEHTRMRECCETHCGHWICDDCDLYWDDLSFSGEPWLDMDASDARAWLHGELGDHRDP